MHLHALSRAGRAGPDPHCLAGDITDAKPRHWILAKDLSWMHQAVVAPRREIPGVLAGGAGQQFRIGE
ncbi:MAG: hypothetical protein F4Z66_05060 [Gammaproteobacteria bacterium]|nr:hypothetical protein [Gammaproteobacteria bacterium]